MTDLIYGIETTGTVNDILPVVNGGVSSPAWESQSV